ncbi:hypothetical protein B0H21DRAFT_372592 [Amylocystis lapponica]|nr:hypothetical protein B0H21DRAFT_372592 [Amylocystis lapponica]
MITVSMATSSEHRTARKTPDESVGSHSSHMSAFEWRRLISSLSLLLHKSRMHLQSLSVEVLILILDGLTVRDLLVCKQVSRFLSQIIDDSERLQYNIDLAIAGMVDSPPGSLCVADRRNMLKEHQKAWCDMQLSPQPTLSISTLGMDSPSINKISGDVYWQRTSTALQFVRLPSRIKGTEEKHWRIDHDTLGFEPHGVAIDPDQDLLVLMQKHQNTHDCCVDIHLLSLATGTPHPLAASKVSTLPMQYVFFANKHIEVHGDSIGWIHLVPLGTVIQVWNWKTNNIIWVSLSRSSFCEALHKFGHLPGNVFPPRGELCPQFFCFFNDHLVALVNFRRLALYAFDAHSASTCKPSRESYVVSLDLFPMIPRAYGSYICIRGGPIASLDVSRPSFERRPASSLFVITMVVTYSPFLIHIPALTIQKCLTKAATDASARNVPWRAWGAQGTRAVHIPDGIDSYSFDVQGSRAAHATQVGAGELCVRVLEFGPVVRHALQNRCASEDDSDVEIPDSKAVYVIKPSVVEAGEVSPETIVTSLPFRMSQCIVRLPGGGSDTNMTVRLYEGGVVIKNGEDWPVYVL